MIRTSSVATACLFACLVALVAGCPNEDRNKSIENSNLCVDSYNKHSFEEAINKCKEALRLWPQNHIAAFTLGQTFKDRKLWKEAGDAYAQAVKELPENVIYNARYGESLYHGAVELERQAQAKKLDVKPESLGDDDLDLRAANFDPAIQYLTAANKINNDIWESHFFLGRIYRAQGKSQLAAQEFTAAIQADPSEQGSVVALAELYRRWDYTDQAIQVASIGSTNVRPVEKRSEVNFVLGMSYLDKTPPKLDDAAKAFEAALEDSHKQNHKAMFELGLTHYAQGDTKRAKKELEEYSKTAGKDEDFNKSMANKVIMDIASKQN